MSFEKDSHYQSRNSRKAPPNRFKSNFHEKPYSQTYRKHYDYKSKYEKNKLKHQTENSLETNYSLYTSTAFPYFRHPKELGSFSLNEERKYVDDKSQLRFYDREFNQFAIGSSLSDGYDTFIAKDEKYKEYLDTLLTFISSNIYKFKAYNEPKSDSETTMKDICTDFVCWRGLLTKILSTPYVDRSYNSWKVSVIKYRNTYYMCEYDTDDKIREAENMTEKQKEMSYWGWKFENYVLSEKEDENPNITDPVNNNLSFVSVVRSRLENHSIVYGGEVDGCEKKPDGSYQYIELKTNLTLKNPKIEKVFKKIKQLKNWLQSFLLNIPKIIVGFRDENGIVEDIDSFDTQEIPTIHGKNLWDACICFNFLKDFLLWVKETVTYDDNSIISSPYIFEYVPNKQRTYFRKCSTREMSHYCFLPEWYFNSIENHFQGSIDVILPYCRSSREDSKAYESTSRKFNRKEEETQPSSSFSDAQQIDD